MAKIKENGPVDDGLEPVRERRGSNSQRGQKKGVDGYKGGPLPGNAAATRRRLNRMINNGELPLEHFLIAMRDNGRTREERMDAAKAAAPYIHPKLAALAVDTNEGRNERPVEATDERLIAIAGADTGAGEATAALEGQFTVKSPGVRKVR